MADLSKIGERDRLKPRPGDEPHWQRLRAGCYVGYRPSQRGGKGTWFARAYDPVAAKNVRSALGSYGGLTGNDVFSAAKMDAEAWADRIERGSVSRDKITTVAEACAAYLLKRPGSIAEGVFRRHVFADAVASIRLEKLQRWHLEEWRARLEATPALISRSHTGLRVTKRRSASTVNRDMVPLRAALGRVLSLGRPGTEAAWQEAFKPAEGADRRRQLYLKKNERALLLDTVAVEARPFLQALCLLPLRPGALAALRCGDFDPATNTLTISKDKDKRERQISVPKNTSTFLSECIGQCTANTPLFRRHDGREWNKDSWKIPIKEAVIAAGLPLTATAYTLRHSVITDLIRADLPALTVAQISGTSIAMIERHYGHLNKNDALEALATLEV